MKRIMPFLFPVINGLLFYVFYFEDETYAIGLILFLYNLFLSVCFSMKLDKKTDESIEDNQDIQIEE